MATKPQRVMAHNEALLGVPATVSQSLRLGRAWANRVGRLAEYDAGTNDEKADIFLTAVFEYHLSVLKGFEGEQAVEVARRQAGDTVDVDFGGTP